MAINEIKDVPQEFVDVAGAEPASPPAGRTTLFTKAKKLLLRNSDGYTHPVRSDALLWGDPDKALARWKIVLADSRGMNGFATIGAYGDSILEGYYCSSLYHRWSEILRRRLAWTAYRTDGGLVNGYYLPMVSGGGAGVGWPGPGPGAGVDPWARVGVTANFENIGGPSNTLVTIAPGAKMTATYVGDSVMVLYTRGPASPNSNAVQVKLDGVIKAAVNPYNVATGYSIPTAMLTPDSGYGQHTIEISNVGVGADIVVEGVYIFQGLGTGNSAVNIYNYANGGSEASNWATAPANSWDEGIKINNPALLIWCLGTNDKTFGRTPAQYEASMKTIVDRCEAAMAAGNMPAHPRPGYLFLLWPGPVDGLGGAVRPDWWAALKRVSDYVPDGRGLSMDMATVLGGVVPAAGTFVQSQILGDLVHPSFDNAQFWLADTLYRLLDPTPPESRMMHTQLIGTAGAAGATVNIYHGFNSRHVKATVTLDATSEEVGVRIRYPSDNYCTIDFDTYVRVANEFRVTVIA